MSQYQVNLVDAGVMVTTWDVYDTYTQSGILATKDTSDESVIKLGKTTMAVADQKESEDSIGASTVTG